MGDRDTVFDPMEGFVSSCCKAKLNIKAPNDDEHTATGLFHCAECGKICLFEPKNEEDDPSKK